MKDVSFEVHKGEVVGIIGRNGAGKSTLLKILSRITEPTTGRAVIHGRVGSLLEVGTGFHPELTGRENIYLNGAILGMRRAEIDRRFDEIVAFSEIERFLDTPVKRYSSGMYVRLAFAVAAHLEPEVLIVDEVLAVGDAAFQKKCLGKMGDVAGEGRTVIFVSHNMAAIARLCRRALLLEDGAVRYEGYSEEATAQYLANGSTSRSERIWPSSGSDPQSSVVELVSARLLDADGLPTDTQYVGDPVRVEVTYRNLQSSVKPVVSLHFLDGQGNLLFVTNDYSNEEWWNTPRSPGTVVATCELPGNLLAEGTVSVLVALCSYNPDIVHQMERDAIGFQVIDRTEGGGARGVYGRTWPGLVRPLLDWRVRSESLRLDDGGCGRV